MERIENIEIHINGKVGNEPLTPDNFDIKELVSILENAEHLLFPTEKNRPIITYEMQEGSVKNIFKTALHSVVTFNAMLGLIHSTNNSIDDIEPKTAIAIEGLQELARKKGYSIDIKTSVEGSHTIRITPNTRFVRSENIWAEGEFYFYGKITNAGGKDKANIHLLTSEHGTLKIKTPISFLEGQEENILYKTVGVRAKGRQNIISKKIDTSELEIINFVNYTPSYDEDYLKSLREKAKSTWLGVDKTQWLNEIRGYDRM